MIKCETMLSLLFFSPMGKSIAIYFFYLVLLKLESQHEFNEKTIFFSLFYFCTMRSLLVIEIPGAKINDLILYSTTEWFFTYEK